MSGKIWTLMNLLTAVSFITHVHNGQCGCMPQDIEIHLYEELMEDHLFEFKVFSPSETNLTEEQLILLSVFNTLCSSWNKNKDNGDKFKAVQTFRMMLHHIIAESYNIECNSSECIGEVCANHNCTGGYKINYVNKTTFGEKFNKTCNESLLDLKCPTKESTTPLTSDAPPNSTASEYLSTTLTETTTHQTTNPKIEQSKQMQKMLINTFSWVLAVSLLLNILLLFCVWYLYKKKKQLENVSQQYQLTEGSLLER
ncbi:uncharacterized protein LOC127451452 isoform X2 [Myxocyprinus asiaticus]|uniref:uncharacterized protein LOC127451452 isoform X2 n=1 Tax=Myxocyprinus asiaticus TaxID=70543 RepID=UPI0022220BE9|nr:uncharacterized protein LOC127451452 isoform X2 [Myxocyprinus asiaticus]